MIGRSGPVTSMRSAVKLREKEAVKLSKMEVYICYAHCGVHEACKKVRNAGFTLNGDGGDDIASY